MKTPSPELMAFAGEVQKDVPSSEVKGLDPLTIATIIMKIIELIVDFIKSRKQKEGLQTSLKDLGWFPRLLLKRAVKHQIGREAWRDGLFERTLDKVKTAPYNQIDTIVNKDLKMGVKV
jgi:hypothetical protein